MVTQLSDQDPWNFTLTIGDMDMRDRLKLEGLTRPQERLIAKLFKAEDYTLTLERGETVTARALEHKGITRKVGLANWRLTIDGVQLVGRADT